VRDELTVIPVQRIEEVLSAASNQDIPTTPLTKRDEATATSTAS
jgi:predicted ATP-dependent protease